MNHNVENKKAVAGWLRSSHAYDVTAKQVHTVEIQLEPALHLINHLGGVYLRGTVGCTVHTGSTAHLYKTFHLDCQQAMLSDTAFSAAEHTAMMEKWSILAYLTTLFLSEQIISRM